MVLSEEQTRIVRAKENRIAVIGPPGTGKTRVLTERIRYLLLSGVPQKDIVAITFTNFAANEMRNRLSDFKELQINTMHSYALHKLLDAGVIHDTKKFTDGNNFDKIIYTATKYPDLFKDVRYLFVDEVQDLCGFEFNFIDMIPAENKFYGGDADQCIYQFKGANPRLFTNYCKDKKTTTYTLTKNYRCGQNIVQFSQYFVLNLPDRIPVMVTGNLLDLGWVKKTDLESALFDLYNSKNYGNWFILTRTNEELEDVAGKLMTYEIPYTTFKQGDFTNEEIEKFLKNSDVKLLTIHAAKGLETDNVIVVGGRNWDAEERCIEYVAATRARHHLYWCPGIVHRRKINYKKKKPVNTNVVKWD